MSDLKDEIIRRLFYKQSQSIAELALFTEKSVPKIASILNELTEYKVVKEDGLGASTGGRRAIHYSLYVDKSPAAIAVSIDQYYTTIAAYDLKQNFLVEPVSHRILINYEVDADEKIMGMIESVLLELSDREILGVGVTMPGFVDSVNKVNSSYGIDTGLFRLCETISKRFGVLSYLENDSTAIALAERHFGDYGFSSNMLVVNLNYGVGLGMIINGEIFKGHSGYAGEFSHIPIADSNKLCACGKRGCLEVAGSLQAAIDIVGAKITAGEPSSLSNNYSEKGYINSKMLLHAALDGDVVAIEALGSISYSLGKGIATLIHLINPEYVVIAGRGALVGDILLPQIQSSLLKYSISRISQHTKLVISGSQNAQLLGALSVVVSNLDSEILIKTHNSNTKQSIQ